MLSVTELFRLKPCGPNSKQGYIILPASVSKQMGMKEKMVHLFIMEEEELLSITDDQLTQKIKDFREYAIKQKEIKELYEKVMQD